MSDIEDVVYECVEKFEARQAAHLSKWERCTRVSLQLVFYYWMFILQGGRVWKLKKQSPLPSVSLSLALLSTLTNSFAFEKENHLRCNHQHEFWLRPFRDNTLLVGKATQRRRTTQLEHTGRKHACTLPILAVQFLGKIMQCILHAACILQAPW